jgi:hypothetical protein
MKPPTVAQLLILADRAERGPLTAAEADRLRAGISGMYRERRTAGARLGVQARNRRVADSRLRVVAALAAAARQRGARSVLLATLDIALGAETATDPGMSA